MDFNVALRGLVPGFEYDLEITWTLEGDQLTQTWKSVVTAETDSYTLREPLVQRNDDFHFGMMAWDLYKKGNDRFLIELTVRDKYPGLSSTVMYNFGVGPRFAYVSTSARAPK